MHRRLHRNSLLTAIAFAAIRSVGFADEVATTWIGGDTTGNWFDATKWSANIPNNNATQTFDATISRSGSAGGPNVSLSQSASINALTLNGTLTFNGIAIDLAIDEGISGNGTISLPTFAANTVVGSTLGPLTIGSGVTINGCGTIGSPNQPLFNHGTIGGGSLTVLAGNGIHNDGVIGPVAFTGTFDRADLGMLNGGSYTILGTLQNQGLTFRVDASTPSWNLGGTVNGGTLSTGDGKRIFIPYFFSVPSPYIAIAHLNNVTVNADLSLDVASRLILDNGQLIGHGDVLLGGTAPEGPSRLQSGTNQLVIQAGFVIHGYGLSGQQGIHDGPGLGEEYGPNHVELIINHGTLRADPGASIFQLKPEFDISGTTVTNDGTLAVASATLMYVSGGMNGPATTLTFAPGGTLAIDLSTTAGLGLLEINGSLDLSTINDSLLLTAGSTIVPGTFYEIVSTTTGVTGTFDSVSPNFVLDYRGATIWAAAVPEPAGFAAIGLGLAMMQRRRNRHCVEKRQA